MNYFGKDKKYVLVFNIEIYWVGNWKFVLLDMLKCGFDGVKCLLESRN